MREMARQGCESSVDVANCDFGNRTESRSPDHQQLMANDGFVGVISVILLLW